jgi:endonuclease YncB( thermonuclease family)
MLLRSAIIVLLSAVAGSAAAETVRGHVRVIDGDSFQFETGLKVRIFGIDTLEKKQKCAVPDACIPCGQQSKDEAIKLIGKSQFVCELRGQKTYDREVATCAIDGKDYGQAMIASGWALAYRSFLPKKGRGHPYVLAEEEAKRVGAGIWGMRFIPPGDWRNHKMRLECERG